MMNTLSARLGGAALVLVAVLVAPDSSAAQSAPRRSQPVFAFPSVDPELQAGLDRVLSRPPFRNLVQRRRLSVALVDLSNPQRIRYAAVDDSRMRYAASLPKIAIMLGVFDQIDRGALRYTPDLRRKMERMIRQSSNPVSTELIQLVGFENIANTLRSERHRLYDPTRRGGLWVGRDYGGGVGLWRRDPINRISHGATARQVARFLVMMDRGELVNPWASGEMKDIMGEPEIRHKFVLGLDERPGSRIYRKSGTWRTWHSDAALVERDGKKYVAVALMESNASGILNRLIIQLDDLVVTPRQPPRTDDAR